MLICQLKVSHIIFYIDTKEGAERFVQALEESMNDPAPRRPLPGKFLTEPDEITEFMKKCKAKYGL